MTSYEDTDQALPETLRGPSTRQEYIAEQVALAHAEKPMQVTFQAKVTIVLDVVGAEDAEEAQERVEEFFSEMLGSTDPRLRDLRSDPIYCSVDGMML